MSKKSRIKKDYDPDFREQAVKLVLIEKMTVSTVARDLGIPVNSLHTWVSKFRKGTWSFTGSSTPAGGDASVLQAKTKQPSSSQKQHSRLQELEANNRELEIKLRRMTQERDILKKAMAYCLDVPK